MKSPVTLLRAMRKRANPQIVVVSGILVVMTIIMSIAVPGFVSPYNIKIMISNFIPEGIIAIGMTLVIISGGIDLSVAGTMPFAAILCALMMKAGIPFGFAILLTLCAGAVIGLINNGLRSFLDVHPFIVTMAMMLTLRGINLVATGNGPISELPESFMAFADIKPLGIQLPFWIFLVVAVLWLVLLRKNRYFRQIYFVGGNPKAAEFSGINTRNVLRFVYVQSSVLAALAGVVAVFTFQAANYSYGLNLEVRVITAVVVGGTSMIKGGIGSIGGTLLGMLFVALIYDAFLMSGISTYYQDMVTGLLLVFAVLFSEQIKKYNVKTKRIRRFT